MRSAHRSIFIIFLYLNAFGIGSCIGYSKTRPKMNSSYRIVKCGAFRQVNASTQCFYRCITSVRECGSTSVFNIRGCLKMLKLRMRMSHCVCRSMGVRIPGIVISNYMMERLILFAIIISLLSVRVVITSASNCLLNN